MAYASTKGRALIDGELYPPIRWTEDPDRCARAGIAPETGFATKPRLGIACSPAPTPPGWSTLNQLVLGLGPGCWSLLSQLARDFNGDLDGAGRKR